jgi:hypothetical protein
VSTGEMRSTFRHIPQAVSPPLLAHLAANAREMSRQLWADVGRDDSRLGFERSFCPPAPARDENGISDRIGPMYDLCQTRQHGSVSPRLSRPGGARPNSCRHLVCRTGRNCHPCDPPQCFDSGAISREKSDYPNQDDTSRRANQPGQLAPLPHADGGWVGWSFVLCRQVSDDEHDCVTRAQHRLRRVPWSKADRRSFSALDPAGSKC